MHFRSWLEYVLFSVSSCFVGRWLIKQLGHSYEETDCTSDVRNENSVKKEGEWRRAKIRKTIFAQRGREDRHTPSRFVPSVPLLCSLLYVKLLTGYGWSSSDPHIVFNICLCISLYLWSKANFCLFNHIKIIFWHKKRKTTVPSLQNRYHFCFRWPHYTPPHS
jgi:hypothetical protein